MADKTPEEILEEARKMIGYETEPVLSRYPVEYDSIRRYCHMVDDDNPLFLDPEYAAQTQHGAVIAPPFFIRNHSGPGVWPPRTEETPSITSIVPTPGDRNVNLNTDFELLEPVKVGDRITVSQKLVDIYIKSVRLDPKTFWLVYETIYRNQHGKPVMITRNTLLRHRTPEQQRAAGDIE